MNFKKVKYFLKSKLFKYHKIVFLGLFISFVFSESLINYYLNISKHPKSKTRVADNRNSSQHRDLKNSSENKVLLNNSTKFYSLPKPLLYIGIMITKNTPISRIDAFRKSFVFSTNTINFKYFFVIGKGFHKPLPHDFWEVEIEENLNEGKTFQWFLEAWKKLKLEPYLHPLSGVVKMDIDCAVNWTKLALDIFPVSIANFYYIGRANQNHICGGGSHCPPLGCIDFANNCWIYMSGGWYALNINLLDIIMNCKFAYEHSVGIEDLLVGQWILYCSPQNVSVSSFDNGNFFCHSNHILDIHVSTMLIDQVSCFK